MQELRAYIFNYFQSYLIINLLHLNFLFIIQRSPPFLCYYSVLCQISQFITNNIYSATFHKAYIHMS